MSTVGVFNTGRNSWYPGSGRSAGQFPNENNGYGQRSTLFTEGDRSAPTTIGTSGSTNRVQQGEGEAPGRKIGMMGSARLDILLTGLCLLAATVHGGTPVPAPTPPDLDIQDALETRSVVLQTPNAMAGAGVKEFVKHSPAFSLLTIKLEHGSSIKAEAGSLVAMQDVDIRTEWGSTKGQGMFGACLGPMLSSLTRTAGGMSFCQNVFTGGGLGVGDIVVHHLNPMSEIFIQPGSFVGCWPNIATTVATKGFKALLSGEGPLFVRASAGIHGGKSGVTPTEAMAQVYLASYGAIEKLLVKEGETVTVDSGHIVAYEDSLTFSIGIAGQYFFGGEGFVCNFRVTDKGNSKSKEGFVYVQCRCSYCPAYRGAYCFDHHDAISSSDIHDDGAARLEMDLALPPAITDLEPDHDKVTG